MVLRGQKVEKQSRRQHLCKVTGASSNHCAGAPPPAARCYWWSGTRTMVGKEHMTTAGAREPIKRESGHGA